MARSLDHDLHAARAAAVHEFAENVEFAELGAVRGVRKAAGTQTVAERDGDIVLREDVQDLVPHHVKRILLVVFHHPLGHDRAAAGDDAHQALHRVRDVTEEETRMERHEVDALLGLGADDVQEEGRIHLGDVALEAGDGLVDRHGAERLRGRVEHALADRLDVLADGEIHHEIGARRKGDGELLKFVTLAGMRHRATEVRVDLRREQAPDADRVAVRVVDVERNHRLARRNGVADRLGGKPFVGGDDLHGLGDDALAGRFKLRHCQFPPSELSDSGSRVFSQPDGTIPPSTPTV